MGSWGAQSISKCCAENTCFPHARGLLAGLESIRYSRRIRRVFRTHQGLAKHLIDEPRTDSPEPLSIQGESVG